MTCSDEEAHASVASLRRQSIVERCWGHVNEAAPKQFAQSDLAAQIRVILDEIGVDPRNVDLEVTATIAMADAERSSLVLSELKGLGVHLSIDDFGTGYSSLSRLQSFPVDALKIDRAFVCKMGRDVETREIVRIVVMLAHNLGLEVVAEGAETEEQVNQLKQMDSKLAQRATAQQMPTLPLAARSQCAARQTPKPNRYHHVRRLIHSELRIFQLF